MDDVPNDITFIKPDELPTFKCLPMVNFIGMCLLSLAMILLWSTTLERGILSEKSGQSSAVIAAEGLILKKATSINNEFPFNIYEPDKKIPRKEGFLMRLPAQGYLPIDFERLAHYSVCCHTLDKSYFVCHSVTQNIGVDCVLQQEKGTKKVFASIIVQHGDMIGATCVLFWKYKK